MGYKMEIHLDELQKMHELFYKLISTPLENIKWLKPNGERVEISDKEIHEFKYLGLNNRDFALHHGLIMNPTPEEH